MAAPTTAAVRGTRLGSFNSAVTSYYVVAGAAAILLVIGLVMVLSSSSVDALTATQGASPYGLFLKQAQWAIVGVVAAAAMSRLPLTWAKRLAWPAMLGAVVAQLLVFTPLGFDRGGNRNWILVAGQSLQPSEFGKLALAMWLGLVLARKRHLLDQWLHVLVPAVLGAGALVGLVLLGHDLGTAIIMLILVAGAFFVAGVPLRMFAVAAGVALVGVVTLAQSSDNRMARIAAFFSDDCDRLGACYQTTRGLYGLGSGGLTGVGLGESTEKWSYLPEAHNDFIFAILGEELGLLGTLAVLVLFALLAFGMSRVIRRHTDPFVQITTAAIATWILGQAVVNIAVVIGLLPVIGVPLPLVSAGGTALVSTLAALGLVLSFARTEPGAPEAFAARPTAVRRSLAVIGRGPARD